MGGGVAKEGFQNGAPDFKYDAMTKCFNTKNGGLLFRLTNKEEMKWAFYNDTKNKEFHVSIVFHGDAKIQPLGNTQLVQGEGWYDNNDDTNYVAEMGEPEEVPTYVATLVVYPLQTEPFIEGTVNGFKATYLVSKVSKEGKEYVKRKEEERKRRLAGEAAAQEERAEEENNAAAEDIGEVPPSQQPPQDTKEEKEEEVPAKAEEEQPNRKASRRQKKVVEEEVTEVQSFD